MDMQGVKVSGWSRAADSYIFLPGHVAPEELQQWISEIGWRIGAGYMYRWFFSPGDAHKHLWGMMRYSIAGMDTALGDTAPDLAEEAERYGVWSWEINCAWRKGEAHSKIFFPKWREADPTLLEDGTSEGAFPVWDGDHPWLRATEPNTGCESQYYFCKPPKYNKQKDVLVKGLRK